MPSTTVQKGGQRRVIDFMKYKTIAMVLSVILFLVSVGSLAIQGINWGLDFTGGTLLELSYDAPVNVQDIRRYLDNSDYEDVVVQEFGSVYDILIRLGGTEDKLGRQLASELKSIHEGEVLIKRIEFVGPQVGERMREQGGIGMLIALSLVMAYVAFRFQFKFSVGAVISLFHDTVLVMGVFSLFQLQFDLTVMAAVLAVIGYSLNDTIIVYDRVRENFSKVRRKTPIEIINISLTQVIGRTLATSGTTTLVLLSLFFLGGDLIHNFSVALLLGIVAGTTSSIYIACSALLYLNLTKDDLFAPVMKDMEGQEITEIE